MKHAWLIIAHNEFKILETLISQLEDPAFDIFIHIDKKVKGISSFLVPQDRLHIVEPRIDVRWGAPSQIEVELLLMSRALQHAQYDYFHIISGTHLPIKSSISCSILKRTTGKKLCIFGKKIAGISAINFSVTIFS